MAKNKPAADMPLPWVPTHKLERERVEAEWQRQRELVEELPACEPRLRRPVAYLKAIKQARE